MVMNHPFDPIAVEAAAKAIFRLSVYQGYDNDTLQSEWLRNKGIMISYTETALTAACQSMKERNLAYDDFISWNGIKTPVTIFKQVKP